MDTFKDISFEPDERGVESLLAKLARLRGSCVVVEVKFVNMPYGAVDISYKLPNTISISLPADYASNDRQEFFWHRCFSAWPLLVAAKMRFVDLCGDCRLWLDDFPSGPGLAFCSNSTSNVLIPDPIFLDSGGYVYFRMPHVLRELKPWSERKNKLFWRGVSTGARPNLGIANWRDLPRLRLCLQVKEYCRDELFDVAISELTQVFPEEVPEINASGIVKEKVEILEFGRYRYSIDIDGNSSSWSGLFSKLAMATLVVKVDSPLGFRQWYYDQLVPWKNFVPLTADMRELLSTAEWLVNHPHEAAAIARRGHEIADRLTLETAIDESLPSIRSYVMRSA